MLQNISCSLTDLLGKEYTQAVARTAAFLHGIPEAEAQAIADEKIDFYPTEFAQRVQALAGEIGQQKLPPFHSIDGAPTDAFRKAAHNGASPLGGIGCFRLGEDGRIYLAAKSEHYQIPLGHNFPGFRLIDQARRLGIPNATHNNTRGTITRLTERRLIQVANGLDWEDDAATEAVLASREPHVLNRVLNLETGSLVVEAGIKMMLQRFYRLDKSFDTPKYQGRIPVFLVMEDNDGGPEANYHGTTVIAQTFRGMWPEFYQAAEAHGLYKVVPVAKNDLADFAEKIRTYNEGSYKTAGFLHEIVLMNYGGILLDQDYLHGAYDLCHQWDTPTLADEIQSCAWYEGGFLFRQLGLHPDFVSVGKGMPGGEYPAAKLLTTAEMDSLSQFGALVTNGQEELANLSYLISLTFLRANGPQITAIHKDFATRLQALHQAHSHLVAAVEGDGLLASIHFHSVEAAVAFTREMNNRCIDVSTQTYKANCPPAALLKLPLVVDDPILDVLFRIMDEILTAMA